MKIVKLMKTVNIAFVVLACALGSMGVEAATSAQVKRWVVQEAHITNVPPALALAVARVESNFRDDAKSHAGARGVMQIMPKTARDEFGVAPRQLWDARLNIRIGLKFLKQLHGMYGGRWDLALSHYNGGSLNRSGPHARPHSYTRKYVADVMKWRRNYERKQTVTKLVQVAESRPARSSKADISPSSPEYLMYEDPFVERNWRDYLKAADHWLTPEDQRKALAVPVVSSIDDDQHEYVRSQRPHRSAKQRRASFRRYLKSGTYPWDTPGGAG